MRNANLLNEIYGEEAAYNIVKKIKKYSHNYGLLFKILDVNLSEVFVSISQLNPDSKKIFDRDDMSEIIHDVFDEYLLPTQELKSSINTIEVSPLRDIDIEWIKRRMYQTSTKIKQMSKDLSIPKNSIDAYFQSPKPLSKIEKGVFYYYLEYRNLLKEANKDNQDLTSDNDEND